MQNCNQRTKNDLKSGKSSDTDEVLTTIDVVPETLLSIAVANGFVDVAATLIAFGEDVNEVVCADGPSPVLFAAQRMQWQCAQLLICANVNRDDVKKAVECAKLSGDASALEQRIDGTEALTDDEWSLLVRNIPSVEEEMRKLSNWAHRLVGESELRRQLPRNGPCRRCIRCTCHMEGFKRPSPS